MMNEGTSCSDYRMIYHFHFGYIVRNMAIEGGQEEKLGKAYFLQDIKIRQI